MRKIDALVDLLRVTAVAIPCATKTTEARGWDLQIVRRRPNDWRKVIETATFVSDQLANG